MRFAGLFAAVLALSAPPGGVLRAQAPAPAATNTTAGAVTLLPPVSISSGIWMQRGFEQERARIRSEVTGLQETLLRNAREQQEMSGRLREAEDRLRRAGEEAVKAQSMAKEIVNARGELDGLRKAMSELENQSIAKEREYVMKLESAAGERSRLEIRLKEAAGQLAAQGDAVTRLRAQVEEGAVQARRNQTLMDDLKGKLTESATARDRVAAERRALEEANTARKAELADLKQKIAAALAAPELAQGDATNLQARVSALTDIRRQLESDIQGKEAALQQAALRMVEREKAEKALRDSLARLDAERKELAARQAEQSEALTAAAARQQALQAEREKAEAALVKEREALAQQVAAKELLLAEQAREQTALQAKLADLSKVGLTLQEQQRQAGLLQANLQRVETDRSALERQAQALRAKLEETEGQSMQLRTESAALAENRDSLKQELAAKLTQITTQEKELQAERERAEGIRKARAEVERRMGALEQELAAEKKRAAELVALAERQKTLREEITKLTQNLEKTETGTRQQSETLAAVMAERDKLKALALDYERSNALQQQELEKQKTLMKDIRETMAFAEKQSALLDDGANAAAGALARMGELQEEVRKQREALDGASRDRSGLEQKIMGMEGEIGRLRKMAETPAPDPALARELESARARMADLQQKLEEREKALKAEQASRAEAAQLMKDLEKGLPAPTPPPVPAPDPAAESLRKEKAALEQALREREAELKALRDAAARIPAPIPTPPPAPPAAPKPVFPPGSADAEFARRLEEAVRRTEENKLAAAAASLDAALEIKPGHVEALYRRAVVKYQQGRLAEARVDIDAVLADRTEHGPSLGLLSLVHWSTGAHEKAREAITRALAAQPDNPQLYNHQGIILNALNDFKGAIAALETAVRMEPDNAESLFNLAALIVSHEPARKEEARRHYEAALKLGLSRDERLEKRLYD